MNPFIYPKSRHARRERPGVLSTYQKYKPSLRREFERKCVYCRMPDSMKDPEMYGVDHYRPKHRFEQLVTSYPNLFYCCNPCNSRKGDYWPPWGRGKTHFIPNPCDHEMFRHLRFKGSSVQSRSDAGKVAEELLDLNDPEVVRYRELILDVLDTYGKMRVELDSVRTELSRQRDTGAVSALDADTAIASIDMDLAKVDAVLGQLAGTLKVATEHQD